MNELTPERLADIKGYMTNVNLPFRVQTDLPLLVAEVERLRTACASRDVDIHDRNLEIERLNKSVLIRQEAFENEALESTKLRGELSTALSTQPAPP